MKISALPVLLAAALLLQGCAVAAAPCRVTGAIMKVVPVIGDPTAAALEACGDAID